MFSCAFCGKHSCEHNDLEHAPKACPSSEEAYTDIEALYSGENLPMAQAAARVEAAGYCKNTRVEETMLFARELGMKRLGIAFCAGLKREAAILARILQENGFEVVSAKCKMGGQPKERLGLEDADKVQPGSFEPMCNPAAQAKYLDDNGAELAIVLGLCVGHDTLFIRSVKAPVTVLAAKDRVLAHNPLGALYLAESYYQKLHTTLTQEE